MAQSPIAPEVVSRLAMPLVRSVTLGHVAEWLTKGWRDIQKCGWLSLMPGLLVAGFGSLLIWLSYDRFWLLAGALSGFLVVAPVLATSLYVLSRALEYKEPVSKTTLLNTWLNWQTYRKSDPNAYWSVFRFGILLALAATGWVVCSAALITLLAPVPIKTPLDFIRHIMLAPQGLTYELWLMMGAVLAAPIFASSAVAIPLLLDRQVSLVMAVETSWRTVLANPVVMVFWAGVIMMLTVLGMASLMLGLIVILPLIGHATWHAYRDLVDASGLPLRQSISGVK
jgi:uncharacterized membrane protein